MSDYIKKAIMALTAALLMTSCGKNIPETNSEISVSSGGKEIAFISEKLYPEDEEGEAYSNVAAKHDLRDTDRNSASSYVSSESWIEQSGEPEYFPIGSVFEMKFPEDLGIPESISINDVLITSEGKLRYDSRAAVKEAVPEINGDTVSFVLDDHLASALSSDSADYKKGTAYRSFGITCEWGEERYRYTFCVRSDPAFIWEE